MRAYFFAHTYLSSIQKGIQSQHCTAEMFRRWEQPNQFKKTLFNWVNNHKTTIILNGGDSVVLNQLATDIAKSSIMLPWGYFNEDASLNFAMTCVGIIVPERIYGAGHVDNLTNSSEKWLFQEIWSRQLAS